MRNRIDLQLERSFSHNDHVSIISFLPSKEVPDDRTGQWQSFLVLIFPYWFPACRIGWPGIFYTILLYYWLPRPDSIKKKGGEITWICSITTDILANLLIINCCLGTKTEFSSLQRLYNLTTNLFWTITFLVICLNSCHILAYSKYKILEIHAYCIYNLPF